MPVKEKTKKMLLKSSYINFRNLFSDVFTSQIYDQIQNQTFTTMKISVKINFLNINEHLKKQKWKFSKKQHFYRAHVLWSI